MHDMAALEAKPSATGHTHARTGPSARVRTKTGVEGYHHRR